MEDCWARGVNPSGKHGLNYWEYFAERPEQFSMISDAARVLDIGTFDGNILINAV